MLLIFLLAFAVLVNCIFYLFFADFLFRGSQDIPNNTKYPVSVLVCAKNESENLRKHVPFWLAQEYPDFELILINDSSSDDTLEVMNHFAATDKRIKIVDVKSNEAFWGSKKYALTLGIKKASHKRMLFTDADCRPASEKWITSMVSPFSEEKQIILGFGAYNKRPGLLNALIRYETVMTALQYFTYAKKGIPYMGVGRNIAYTSNIFYTNNGFTSHMNVLSGDDDLFVNRAATRTNTALQYSPESFTYSVPKETWGGWLRQKRRHSSTAMFYKSIHKLLLSCYYFFNLFFWIMAIASLIFDSWKLALSLILFRLLFQIVVHGKAVVKLKEPGLVHLIPILELFLVCLQLSIFINGRMSKRSPWK